MNELERIRRSIDALASAPGWDWTNFASTLIATLVGAAAAGAVTLWVLRRQRRDAYEAVIREVATRALSASIEYTETVLLKPPGTNVFTQVQRLQAELLMLEAVSNTEDAKIAYALHASAVRVLVMPPGDSGKASAAVSRSITDFVARKDSVDVQLRRINSIAPTTEPS